MGLLSDSVSTRSPSIPSCFLSAEEGSAELRRPVRGPHSIWDQSQGTEGEEYPIIIDTPTREVLPGLIPVCFEWNAVFGKLRANVIELSPADANGVSRVIWIGRVFDTKEIRNTA